MAAERIPGNRRTLLDGLPSGINDVGIPSGPAGIIMRGRNLYVVIGVGDVGIHGPFPGTALPNPNGPSSPIFSAVLALQFSAAMEQSTGGLMLTAAHQQALANGETVTLGRGRDQMSIRLIADFPNFVPFPLPTFAENVQLSNPYDLVAVDDALYVTDGGRNHVWQIDLLTNSISTLVAFPNIPNPLFPALGGPFIQAVPTGIAAFEDHLLVALFRGGPFPTGVSTVEQINPLTASVTQVIGNLTTAIDVLPSRTRGSTSYLVLQHASAGPFFAAPGSLLRFDDPAGSPVVVADCLSEPSSMTPDEKRGILYISDLDGRILTVNSAEKALGRD